MKLKRQHSPKERKQYGRPKLHQEFEECKKAQHLQMEKQ